MKQNQRKLIRRRQALLERISRLSLLVHGSYLERFSTCIRSDCACHRGEKHGPRSYVVVYHEQRQRQVYIRNAQRKLILKGLRQHDQLTEIVNEITRINLQMMREGVLEESISQPQKGGKQHG